MRLIITDDTQSRRPGLRPGGKPSPCSLHVLHHLLSDNPLSCVSLTQVVEVSFVMEERLTVVQVSL